MPSVLARVRDWFVGTKTVGDGAKLSESALQLVSGLSTGRNPPRRGTEELIAAYRQIPILRSLVQRIAENFAAIQWTVHRLNGSDGKAVRARGLERMAPEMRIKALAKAAASGQAEELTDDPLLDFLDAGNAMLNGFVCRQVMATHLELKGEAYAWLERSPLGMPIAFWPLSPAWVRDVPAPGKDTFEVTISGSSRIIQRADMLAITDPDPENPYGRGTGIGESLDDELDTSEYLSAFIKAFFYNNAQASFLLAFPSAEGITTETLKVVEQQWQEKHRGAARGHIGHFLNHAPQVTQFGQSFKDMSLVDLQKFLRSVCRETFGMPPEIMGLIESSNRATIEAAGYIFARWLLVPRATRWNIALQRDLVPQFDERKILSFVSPVPEDKAFELTVAQANPAARTRNEWRALQGLHGRGPEDDVYLQSAILIERPAPTPPELRARSRSKALAVTKDESDGVINQALAALKPDRLADETRSLWEEELEAWGQQALDALGVDISFDMTNPLVKFHLNDFSGTRIKGINDTTRDAVRAQLVEGFEAGEGYKDLAARVREVFTDCDRRRSETIARTETMRSSNFSEHQAQIMSGVVEEREWIATPDDRVRDEHLALNGTVVGLNEKFDVGGEDALYPGDDSLSAAMAINCRCTTAAHFSDKAYTDEERKAIWKVFDGKLGAWERAAKAAFRRGFEAQRDDVLGALRDASGD